MLKLTLPLLLGLLATTAALAAPTLRADITVTGDIVTVGDMFDDAGDLATLPLFRAPAPGTAGIIDLNAVRDAARRAGVSGYSTAGLAEVRVARSAAHVDASLLGGLVAAELAARGLVPAGAEPVARFRDPNLSFSVEAVAEPARLIDLRYQASDHAFSARFTLAGIARPDGLTGSIDLLVDAPHLVNSLKAGDVVTPADIEMRQVPMNVADQAQTGSLADLVGKAVRRNARAGVMLKPADVAEPMIVIRNAEVNVLFRTGPMVLSLQGQALTAGALGDQVQVLNPVSRKILFGKATAPGTVEVAAGAQLAGL